MQVALTAYQLLERFYRQSVPANGAPSERHRTTESLLRCLFSGQGNQAFGAANKLPRKPQKALLTKWKASMALFLHV